MLALTRLAALTRPAHVARSTLPTISPLVTRSYRSDSAPTPGRSLAADERRRLREAISRKSGRVGAANRSQLDSLLDSEIPQDGLGLRRGRGDRNSLSDYQAGGASMSYRPREREERGATRGGGGGGGGDRRGPRKPTSVTDRMAAHRSASLAGTTTPYMSSLKVKKWLDRHRDRDITHEQSEELIRMVEEMPKSAVNAAVYNLVFAHLGRSKRFTRLWRLYNAMKRRGITPTSRTYTTVLNAYGGFAHSGDQSVHFAPGSRPESLTLERVKIIYTASQTHIGKLKAKADAAKEQEEETGMAAPSGRGHAGRDYQRQQLVEEEEELDSREINVLPTNAYLKFLGRFGMWEDMERVFLSMDRDGPLAPDQVTFWTMLKAAQNIHGLQKLAQDGVKVASTDPINFGPTVKSYWEQAVRQLCAASAHGHRKMDNELALLAVDCLSQGRPEDRRLADQLIPALWRVPSATAPAAASSSSSSSSSRSRNPFADLPPVYQTLPTFKLDIKTATSLLTLLRRSGNKTVGRFYAHYMLDLEPLQKDFDMGFLRALVLVLAHGDDISGVLKVLDSFQPPSGQDGWPLEVWLAALDAARWSQDWEAALGLFRRMVHLPAGVVKKNGLPYAYTTPNGEPTDIRGKKWIPPRVLRPEPTAMATLLRASIACGAQGGGSQPMRQALAVYEHYGGAYWNTITYHETRGAHGQRVGAGYAVDLRQMRDAAAMDHMRAGLPGVTRAAIQHRIDLAKEVGLTAERVVFAPKDAAEADAMRAYMRAQSEFVSFWEDVLFSAAVKKAKADEAGRPAADRKARERAVKRAVREEGDQLGAEKRASKGRAVFDVEGVDFDAVGPELQQVGAGAVYATYEPAHGAVREERAERGRGGGHGGHREARAPRRERDRVERRERGGGRFEQRDFRPSSRGDREEFGGRRERRPAKEDDGFDRDWE